MITVGSRVLLLLSAKVTQNCRLLVKLPVSFLSSLLHKKQNSLRSNSCFYDIFSDFRSLYFTGRGWGISLVLPKNHKVPRTDYRRALQTLNCIIVFEVRRKSLIFLELGTTFFQEKVVRIILLYPFG